MKLLFKIQFAIIAFALLAFSQPIFSQANSTPYPFTSSLVPKDAYVFYVIGDWGRKGKYFQKDVAAAMNTCAAQAKPKFIASTGDNFYTFGVKNTTDKLWKKSFEDIYNGANIKDIDWYVVLGNHDGYGNIHAQIDYSKKNSHWKLPTAYHSYVAPVNQTDSAEFIFTYTGPLANTNSASTQAQWNWIDSSLAHSTAKWKFVFGHHPVYSSNPLHGDTWALIEKLKPMLEKYHVPAYFAGHDHDLQHQQPKGSPVDYFVSGAGSKLRPSGTYAHTKFARSVAGFAVVSLSGNKMTVWFVDKDANVIYSYSK